MATADLCPVTGRARLSYRRAAELFEQSTRRLAHPEATSAELASLRGPERQPPPRDAQVAVQLRHRAG